MEPRPNNGDDNVVDVTVGVVLRAAMEPCLDDGDDRRWHVESPARLDAAMEPRPDDGDDAQDVDWAIRLRVPQWSPVLTTGTTNA